MSASLAARTACYDVFERRWLGEILDRVHAPPLPDLLGAGTVVGRVRRGAHAGRA